MKTYLFLLSILTVLVIYACKSSSDGMMCTMEFRTVTITVNGSDLDSYFTIRQLTGDTIRIVRVNISGDKVYPVLDDNFQHLLQDQTENFRFQGMINGNVVVDEPFVIKADKCHIQYVSGRTVI